MLGRTRNAVLTFGTAWLAIRAGQGIVTAGIQLQSLQNRMVAATGDAKIAADAMGFLREESNRLGLDFRTTADSFGNFSASSLRAGMTLQQTKDVFTSVAEAATALHLSTASTQSAFLALEQMASKGTVQMQELKLQLAQAIPGAFEIMAKAMGKTLPQFNEMISKGEVLASDALPKLGAELHREFGERAVVSADSAQAAINRFGNAIFDLQSKLAGGGFLDAVTKGVTNLTDALNDPATQEGLKGFATLLGQVSEKALEAASAVGSLYNSMNKQIEAGGNSLFGALFGDEGVKALETARQRKAQFGDASIKADNASTSQYKGNAQLDGMLAQAAAGAAGNGNGSYSLGKVSTEPTAAQLKAAEKAAKLRESLFNKVSNIDEKNARTSDPQKAAALELEEQEKTLKKALDAKAITEQQYRDKSLQAEVAYQDRLTDIRQKAADIETSIREQTYDNIAGLLQVFAGKNKAVALALLVFEKARAIAQTIIATHVAATTALIYDPTGATSARVTAMGYANVALIAATGIAQLATMGGGGSSSSGVSSSGDTSSVGDSTAASSAPPQQKSIFINLQGDNTLYSKDSIRKLIAGINDALSDGTRLNVVTSS